MPASKQKDLARAFKALADPTRLEIVRLVSAQASSVCVCDIVDRFELGQPTISHHLKVLREAELVDMSRQGIWAFYSLSGRAREILGEVSMLLGADETMAEREAS